MNKTKTQEKSMKEKRLHILHLRKMRKIIRRRIIIFCILLIPLSIYIQSLLFKGKTTLPIDNNILIFALININVLLVLVVLFLVLRNLVDVLFERRTNKLGNKLKTKLIASFLSLTLVPTVLLFFVSLQFVSTSMDYWFNSSVENSLTESLELAQSLLHEKEKQAVLINNAMGERLKNLVLTDYSITELQQHLENIFYFNPINGPDAVRLLTNNKNLEITVKGTQLQNSILPRIPSSILKKSRSEKTTETLIQEMKRGDLVSCITEITIGNSSDSQNNIGKSLLITSLLVPKKQLTKMNVISEGIEGYRQLKHFKEPFKFWLLVILMIVTLMVIFAAIWFGVYISRGITEPLENLVLATMRVAEGDLKFEIEKESNDEMGLLVESFNTMTSNLNQSNLKLEETHKALQTSSQESEQRRRYTEIRGSAQYR